MFVGLLQDLPHNTFVPLAQTEYHTGIVAAESGVYQMTNVCPHQNSLITCAPTQQLTCPYHGLSYTLQGQGIKHNYALEKSPVYVHNNLMSTSDVAQYWPVDLRHMVLQEQRVDVVESTTDIIMDVFLDIDHIPHAHNGVYDQIDVHDVSGIQTQLYPNASLQLVPGVTKFTITDDQQVDAGAVWLAMYPGTMIEWQPGALFVTVARTNKQGSCDVHVFKYRDIRYPVSTWYINKSTWEQAWQQDRDLAQHIVSLPTQDLNNLKQHHRDWLKNEML